MNKLLSYLKQLNNVRWEIETHNSDNVVMISVDDDYILSCVFMNDCVYLITSNEKGEFFRMFDECYKTEKGIDRAKELISQKRQTDKGSNFFLMQQEITKISPGVGYFAKYYDHTRADFTVTTGTKQIYTRFENGTYSVRDNSWLVTEYDYYTDEAETFSRLVELLGDKK